MENQISEKELLKKIEEQQAINNEICRKEDLRLAAISLDMCPVCGEKLIEKTITSMMKVLFIFKFKRNKVYKICSKDINHYKEVEYYDYDDDDYDYHC